MIVVDEVRDIVLARVGNLSPAQKRCARVLLARYPAPGLGTALAWATEAGTSMPTVLRFVARLGFGTYQDFQQRLREESIRHATSPVQRATRSRHDTKKGDFKELAEWRIRIADEVARTVPASEFTAAVRLLAGNPRRIYLTGGFFTTHLAALLAAQLGHILRGVAHTPAPLVTDIAKYLDLDAGDVVVIFDLRRYEESAYQVAELVKRRKAELILITDQEMSPVAALADVVLPVFVDGVPFDSHSGVFVLLESIVEGVFDTLGKVALKRMERWEESVRITRTQVHRPTSRAATPQRKT